KKPDSAPYSDALFEVTLVAVLAPCLAVYSCLLITSLAWAPKLTARWPNVSPKGVGLLIGLLALSAGGIWFSRRFRAYRGDLRSFSVFDSERDRRVVFWQKFWIMTSCAI